MLSNFKLTQLMLRNKGFKMSLLWTHLTVKTSQICECKLLVSVAFLNDAENFFLKVKLKKKKR